ncbi:MAG: cell division protein ZapE [Pseudomonadota bacterium]
MNVREAYESSLQRDGHDRDDDQAALIDKLAALQSALESPTGLRWYWPFGRASATAVKGLYIWGGVGRGKTFLMDLFYQSLAIKQKRRVHFHRVMHEVHERLAALGDIEDPLDRVANDIAADTRVLCFDEFFVSDIGDAMILGRLLDGLFTRGVTLITTSNAHPDDLYKDGLQRSRFLPAIESLKANTEIFEMTGSVDYRLRLLEQAGTYRSPDDDEARAALRHYFNEAASGDRRTDCALTVNGRDIPAVGTAKGIAWFDFHAICGGPRSQNDYIELARWFPSVIVSGVPELDRTLEDEARRFVALIDEFYDRRVKMVISAAASIDNLYTGKKLRFEFERTSSRLIEMQSTEYLASPHLA